MQPPCIRSIQSCLIGLPLVLVNSQINNEMKYYQAELLIRSLRQIKRRKRNFMVPPWGNVRVAAASRTEKQSGSQGRIIYTFIIQLSFIRPDEGCWKKKVPIFSPFPASCTPLATENCRRSRAICSDSSGTAQRGGGEMTCHLSNQSRLPTVSKTVQLLSLAQQCTYLWIAKPEI